MKKMFMAGLLLLATNWFKKFNPYSSASMDLTKLKIAMGYLQTIKTLRLLFISLLGAGVCLVLLLSGIILFHLAIFFYAPWTMEVKMIVTLSCAAAYVLAAVAVFIYAFSEDKWMKIFNADKMIKQLSGDEESNDTTAERTEFARHSSL